MSDVYDASAFRWKPVDPQVINVVCLCLFKYWTEGALSYTSEEIGSVRPVDGKYLIMWSQQDMLHYLGTTNKCVVLYCVVLCCVCVAPRGCDNSWTRSHCMPCRFFRQSKPELDWCFPIFESIVCDSQQTASKGDPGRACVCVCVLFACLHFFACMLDSHSDAEVSRQIPAETWRFAKPSQLCIRRTR